jgi:hypothetical protein
MSGRRIDVTATQAASSMLATLTGAIAASGLGIGGTIIGAAFMSLASTVGAAVYKHYIGRSNERLRAAAGATTQLRPRRCAATGGQLERPEPRRPTGRLRHRRLRPTGRRPRYCRPSWACPIGGRTPATARPNRRPPTTLARLPRPRQPGMGPLPRTRTRLVPGSGRVPGFPRDPATRRAPGRPAARRRARRPRARSTGPGANGSCWPRQRSVCSLSLWVSSPRSRRSSASLWTRLSGTTRAPARPSVAW